MSVQRKNARARIATGITLFSVMAGGLIAPLIAFHPAQAQTPGAPVQTPGAPVIPDPTPDDIKKAREFGVLLDALDDIDRLHALNPLKLSSSQVDKIIATVTSAAADYNKKSALLGMPEITKMAEEIRTVRKTALTGGDIPKDFDDRIIKTQADIAARRDTLNKINLRSLSTALRAILSPAQIATAAKLSKDAAAKLGQEAEGRDDQWFNSYVLDTFINNPRVVLLLKSIRSATSPSTDGK